MRPVRIFLQVFSFLAGVMKKGLLFLAGLFVSCRRDEKGFTVRCVILGVTETKEN
jgi:hypothetical protein